MTIAVGASAILTNLFCSILIVCPGGAAVGLLFVAQILWCLGMLPPQQAGLATGRYFGGMGAATSLLSLLLITLAR